MAACERVVHLQKICDNTRASLIQGEFAPPERGGGDLYSLVLC